MSNRRLSARRVPQVLCRHRLAVCSVCVTVEDAAKRIADTINAMLVYHQPWDIRTKWMAFRLQDGKSDKALYDSKREAVRHQPNEYHYMYFTFRNALGGVNARDMQIYLNMCRAAADSPYVNMADADDVNGGSSPILPYSSYDAAMGRMRGNGPFWT